MNKRKKVVSFVFNDFTNDSRVLKEAISLQNNGFDVEVVGHLDVGLSKDEIIQGIKVKRVSFLNRKIATTLNKVFAYLKYVWQSAKIGRKSDILHCNDLNTLPIAFLVKTFFNRKVKVVYDAHEYETQVNGHSERMKKLTAIFERWLIRYADKTITVSQSIAEEYKKLYPEIEMPALVLNCPPLRSETKKKNIFRKRFNIPKEATIFLYQGSLSKGRGLEIIVEAFRQSQDKNNVLVIMGYGNLEDYARELSGKEENIFFHEAVSPKVLLDYTSSADLGISTIENTCLSYYYCLPNKMFEYMMAGIPLIVSNLPEMKRVVEKYNIGVVAEENTQNGILKAVQKASQLDLNQMKDNLQKARQEFNWENQEKELLKIYHSL